MINEIFLVVHSLWQLRNNILKSQTFCLSISLFVAREQHVNRKLWGSISTVEAYKVFGLDTEMDKLQDDWFKCQ